MSSLNTQGALADTDTTHWAQIEEKTFVHGLRLMCAIHRWLGRGPFLLVLYPVVVYFWLTNRLARQASMQYLQRLQAVYPSFKKGPRWYHGVGHFLSFANTILDKTLATSGRYRFDALKFAGYSSIDSFLQQGQGGIIVTAHMGCLEMCQAAAHQFGTAKINVLVHVEHAEKFNQLLGELNAQRTVRLIHVNDITPATAMMLADRVGQGEFVAIAGDRIPVRGGKTVQASFLKHEASLPVGPYVLAALLKCPLFFMGCVREGRAHALHFDKLADSVVLPTAKRPCATTPSFIRRVSKLCWPRHPWSGLTSFLFGIKKRRHHEHDAHCYF